VTLLGRVKVGDYSFIGANSVVKEGISIGNNCIIGAGTVVLCDVPSGVTMVGNPGKIIKKN
jgi:acetyltransferase-like isoleucine patch superfamily enzyme